MGKKAHSTGAAFAVYLLGLLVGGLYVGMVAPVRTVVQAGFGLRDSDGIWMINVYTLFYAAFIPVMGKLSDRRGSKPVFTACLLVFMAGSVLCGLSRDVGGFALLLVGRVVQAVGAGGTIPVANAAIGTLFPPERRGAALGIAAAVAGIANVLGAAVGSAIVGLAGTGNWPLMFYLAVPLCACIALAAAVVLESSPGHARGRLDVAGSALFVVFVLALLLGLKDLDFSGLSALGASFARPETWVPLLVALACLPAFRAVERRAADPVFHLEYLHSRPIAVTMAVSFFIGCAIISMMLVPEFAEFAMGDPVGSGGYYLLAIGVAAMVGPPLGGKLIDRVGPKPVLMGGFAAMIAGYLFLALVAAAHPSAPLLVAGLAVVGLGMGFAMGAPTNYMILENTGAEESGSAVATIALVRQIGTSVAPALLVGFIGDGTSMLGYQQMLACVAAFCAAGLVLMLFYRSPAPR